MAYSRTVFGKAEDGTEIELFTLVNGRGTKASFSSQGAVWVSMEVKDRSGRVDDVILGYDNPENYRDDGVFLGAVVGRNANRIADATFSLNGKEIRLAANDGPNNLHSGMDYYKRRIWAAQAEETALGSSVMFSLISPEGDQGYPGTAQITVGYTLTEDDSVILRYHMICDADTVANLTNHCYFNLAGHQTGDITSQKVWINSDFFTPVDDKLIPTGEERPVAGTPMDFTSPKPIGEEIDSDYEQIVLGGGYDHNWCLKDYDGEVRLAARAVDEDGGRAMEVYTDMPGVQFYTGNFLDGVLTGKGGAVYEKRSGYCFETQFFPDAVNHPEFLSPLLKAGEEFDSTTIYAFTVAD